MAAFTPDTLFLRENQILRFGEGVLDGRMLRVLWLPDAAKVCLIDVEDSRGLPSWSTMAELEAQFSDGVLEPLSADVVGATIRADHDLSEAERAARDRRMAIIRPLVDDAERRVLQGSLRGKLVARQAWSAGVGRNHVIRYLRLWWQLGQLPNALVPKLSRCGDAGRSREPGAAKRGRPRLGLVAAGINIDAEAAAKLADGARFLAKGRSQTAAYNDTLRLHFSNQVVRDGVRFNEVIHRDERPSFAQFIYWATKKRVRSELLQDLKGAAKYERNYAPKLGTARDRSFGPGSIYQIDATIANIFLRSRKSKDKLIGRPVLYLVIDHYSRMIVGFHVGLSGPSWEVAKMALEVTYTEKVSFCAQYGVTITDDEWPTGVPSVLTGDRGWDVIGKHAAEAAAGLNYKPETLPPYRPDLKGLVESRFELLDGNVKWLPGATHGRSRGDVKRDLDGVYTLTSFTQLMLQLVLHYNRSFAVLDPPASFATLDGHIPSPLELYTYGTRLNKPQVFDRDRVRANLMHVGYAKETDGGLFFNRLLYIPANESLSEMFVSFPNRKWRSDIKVRFDPRDVGMILMPLDRGARFEQFKLHPKFQAYDGWTQEEVADDLSNQPEQRRIAADRRLRSETMLEAHVADITQAARQELEGTAATKKQARADRSARSDERRQTREDEAWTRRGESTAAAAVPQASAGVPRASAGQTDEKHAAKAAKPNYTDTLLAARAAGRRAPGAGS
jgi:putative transposase